MFVYLDKIFRNIFCDKRLKTCFTPYFPDEPKTTGTERGSKKKKVKDLMAVHGQIKPVTVKKTKT